jgi:hypothetical protein
MRTAICIFLGLVPLLAASEAQAQVNNPSAADSASVGLAIPRVLIDSRATEFQASLYPDYYATRPASRDQTWVTQNDSLFTAFWQEKGDSILVILSRLAGIDWVDKTIDLYLLRYYPGVGGPDPLVIPLGGIRQGALIEAVPTGCRMQLNIVYQFSRRLLGQAGRSDTPTLWSLAGHPLMRPGSYTRDNLAMLLALATAQRVIGPDSTDIAWRSAFWTKRTPGREMLEKYLLSKWTLTENRTLAQWVADESTESELVSLALFTQGTSQQVNTARRPVYVQGLPLKGQFGFSVRSDDRGQFMVDRIDSTRLAYASGLRTGDIIRSVDGSRVKSHKDMIERLLAGLDAGGATMSIMRGDRALLLVIQPSDLSSGGTVPSGDSIPSPTRPDSSMVGDRTR